MFSLVMNNQTTANCWKTREIHLSSRKMSHSQSIRDQLWDLKKFDTESMGEYVIMVRALVDIFPQQETTPIVTSSILSLRALDQTFDPLYLQSIHNIISYLKTFSPNR